MKKLFALALVVFGLAACQTDHSDLDVQFDGTTTICLSLPEDVATRAAVNSDSAKGGLDNTTEETIRFILAIYDEGDNEQIRMTQWAEEGTLTANFPVRLVPGRKYTFVAWADMVDDVDAGDKHYNTEYLTNITLNVNSEWNAMDETRDAFTASKTIASYSSTEDLNMQLTRPFAKLRVIATDVADLARLDLTADKATVTYTKPIPVSYNAFEQKVGAATESKVHTKFALVGANDEKLYGDNSETQMVLYTDYIFADTEQDAVKFSLTTYDQNDTKIKQVDFNTDIPVKRNMLTTLTGNVMTEGDNVTVKINEKFGEVDTEQYVRSLAELQAAVDAAVDAAAENVTICFGADIEGDVTVIQKPGVKITINGKNQKYTGSIKVHSNSNHYADAALTIKNVNFETATASTNFIEALENGAERYSCNITVENCTFTATGDAVNTAVGVQIKASKNAKVLNCTATDVHSLIQAQSCDEKVEVIDCNIDGKNGVAFKQVKAATVEGTTIVATGYGIRFDGNIDNYGITVKNNDVTAKQPFIVRKMTGKDNTITLEGTNTLTVPAASISTETPAYQIIITNGSDDEAYVKPTGTYTLTGADNYLVYPRDVYFLVATWDEFTAALAANEPKIKLTDNIEYSGNYSLKKDVVIDLNGKSITMPMFYVFSTATIMNGTINGKMYARTGCKATLEGLTFSGTISDDLSTEGHLQVQGSCDVYAKNCTFAATTVNGSQTRSLSIEGSSSGIRKFEGCDFKFVSWGNGAGKYKKNVYINTMNGTTTVDFTDCKLNGKAPNIIFAAAYPLTNLTMSGCDNTAPTLEISRAKDTVTEVEWAHISSLIANNKFTQVRVFYAGGSSEYIK